MIRINLLAGNRQRRKKRIAFDPNQLVPVICALVLLATAVGIGWWYWTMSQAAAQLQLEIAAAQQETERLRSVLDQVEQFEARRAQLQQRVALIEQLRQGQGQPVRMLDEVSRAVPDEIWLVDMRQEGADVTIEGRSTTLMALSDFIGNLEGSGYFALPVEILDSRVEQNTQGGGLTQQTIDIISFTVKAQFSPPPAP